MSKSRALLEFYEPLSRVTTASADKSRDISHCDEHASGSTAVFDDSSSSEEDSADDGGDTALRDNAPMEHSPE